MVLTRTQPKKIYIPVQKTAIYTPNSYTSLYMPLDGSYNNLGNDIYTITSENNLFYDNTTFQAGYTTAWAGPEIVAGTLATPIDTYSCTISLRAFHMGSQPSGEWGWCNYIALKTDPNSVWSGLLLSKVGTNSYYGSNVNKIALSIASGVDTFTPITAVQMTWYHLCITGDNSSVSVYINGNLEATTSQYSYNCPYVGIAGGLPGGTSEVIIESRPWTASEVLSYYNDNASRFIFN